MVVGTTADTDGCKLAYFIIPLILSNLVVDLCDGIVVAAIGHLGSAEIASLFYLKLTHALARLGTHEKLVENPIQLTRSLRAESHTWISY